MTSSYCADDCSKPPSLLNKLKFSVVLWTEMTLTHCVFGTLLYVCINVLGSTMRLLVSMELYVDSWIGYYVKS